MPLSFLKDYRQSEVFERQSKEIEAKYNFQKAVINRLDLLAKILAGR